MKTFSLTILLLITALQLFAQQQQQQKQTLPSQQQARQVRGGRLTVLLDEVQFPVHPSSSVEFQRDESAGVAGSTYKTEFSISRPFESNSEWLKWFKESGAKSLPRPLIIEMTTQAGKTALTESGDATIKKYEIDARGLETITLEVKNIRLK